MGDRILLPRQCSEFVCIEGLKAGESELLAGAAVQNVSHHEELTLNLVTVHKRSNCCLLSADAEVEGTTIENGTMVQEGEYNKHIFV